MAGWTGDRNGGFGWRVGVGVGQERVGYGGVIERELMLVGGHKGALRNEQLFVGLVGVQQAGHLPPSPQSHFTPSSKSFLFSVSYYYVSLSHPTCLQKL